MTSVPVAGPPALISIQNRPQVTVGVPEKVAGREKPDTKIELLESIQKTSCSNPKQFPNFKFKTNHLYI